jgi:Ca-activated chloride channel family protein
MRKAYAVLILAALCSAVGTAAEDDIQAVVVRLLVPPGQEVAGKIEVEVLAIDPEIRELVFLVDGEEAAKSKHLPWNVKVQLAKPAREQTLVVVAYGRGDKELGRDTVVVNQKPIPFRVHLTSIVPSADAVDIAVDIVAAVSIPRGAELDKVELYWNEGLKTVARSAEINERLPIDAAVTATDFVRAVAHLKDGRSVEDVEVLSAPGLAEEVDVNLVQLQVLVTKKNGAPVTDLTATDFEIVQGGQTRPIHSLRTAGDVPLVLGLVLDSSGSMQPIWRLSVDTAKSFLKSSVRTGDRAFLVDFDSQLRLRQPLTSQLSDIFTTLDGIRPEGGTALFDSMAFSLLQFRDEPGRRALVVLSDGIDSGSTTTDKTVVAFAQKLGVPIYVVALPAGGQPHGAGGAASMVHALKLITDPSGGRLLRLGAGSLDRAFAQINAELRHQYVIAFYTDQLPDDKKQKVTIRVKTRKGVEVRAVLAWDQMS